MSGDLEIEARMAVIKRAIRRMVCMHDYEVTVPGRQYGDLLVTGKATCTKCGDEKVIA